MQFLQKTFAYFKKLFGGFKTPSNSVTRSPGVGDRVGNITILTDAQAIKHTPLKVGDSYRLGSSTVTLRASQAEVAAIIAMYDRERARKEARLTKRANEIMLMSPKELEQFKVQEWLDAQQEYLKKIGKVMEQPTTPPSSGNKAIRINKQFLEIVKELIKDDDKVS